MKMEATTATKPRSSTATATVPQETNAPSLAHVAATGAVANLSTHPLVSAFSAAYLLGVLYLPRCVLSLLLSPALVSALLLLATLFYFGSSSRHDHPRTRSPPLRQEPLRSADQQQPRQEPEHHQLLSLPQSPTTPDAEFDSPVAVLCWTQKPLLLPEHRHFVEWPRWGSLEVIYEEYEEEVDEDDEDVVRWRGYSGSPRRGRCPGTEEMERVAPLAYSDDSATSSGGGSSPAWELPEDLFLRWDAEEEGLIEIPLEEDNLIEIDISAYL